MVPIPVTRARQLRDARPAISETRDHPHILNGAPAKHPTGVNFAAAGMRRSVFGNRRDVHFPLSYEEGVQREFRFALRVRPRGMQHLAERIGEGIRLRLLRAACSSHQDSPRNPSFTSTSAVRYAVGTCRRCLWERPYLMPLLRNSITKQWETLVIASDTRDKAASRKPGDAERDECSSFTVERESGHARLHEVSGEVVEQECEYG